MSMNCNGCEYDGFIMLGDKKASYCKYFRETKRNMDRAIDVLYYPFQHGYCLHKTNDDELSLKSDVYGKFIYESDAENQVKLQLPPETSTNGTYIRDGRLMHDLVYRGEAEGTDTDTISRQAAIEVVSHVKKDEQWQTPLVNNVIRLLNALPPVEPEQPKGEWVDRQEGTFCSECDYKTNEYHNFCPVCGADMRGEEK